MEDLREKVQDKLIEKIRHSKSSISISTKISVPTLTKIEKGEGFVSRAKLMELDRLIDDC